MLFHELAYAKVIPFYEIFAKVRNVTKDTHRDMTDVQTAPELGPMAPHWRSTHRKPHDTPYHYQAMQADRPAMT